MQFCFVLQCIPKHSIEALKKIMIDMKEYYESHVSTHVFKALDQMLYVRHDTGRNCLYDPSKLHI